jgi:hypothetical protein
LACEALVIIARRVLTLRQPGGDTQMEIRLFAPEQNDGTWDCRYEIDWPEGQESRTAAGADSVQALLIALHMIGADLYTSAHHKAGHLVSGTPGRGYGFPVPHNIRDLLVGDDARYF